MNFSNHTYNWAFNASFNVMENPIIKFPNQDLYIHRQVIFLKCFMVAVLENKAMARDLIQVLQKYFTAFYMVLTAVLLAHAWTWKVLPLMLFFYVCLLLKLFAFESSARRSISFVFYTFCCFAIAGFEFVYDVYFILCFLGMSLYSLYMQKDRNGEDRGVLQRVAAMLVFFIEFGLVYFSDQVGYRFSLFVNAGLTIYEVRKYSVRVMNVAIMYSVVALFLLGCHMLEFDLDRSFEHFVHSTWNNLKEFSGRVRWGKMSHGVMWAI